MRISTKGRYALRVMIDLAQHSKDEYVLLTGARGKAGGYRLNCEPANCSVWQILSVVETSVSPVACLDEKENSCERADICITLPVWKELHSMIKDYLDGVKLDQFLRNSPKAKGKIPGGKNWNCGL